MLISNKRNSFLFFISLNFEEIEHVGCYGRPIPPVAGLAPI